jgi:hypothetical protein
MSRIAKRYCPAHNFVRCRFCEAAIAIGLHRNSKVTAESVKEIETKGWVYTGREKGKWSGICPDCNIFFAKGTPVSPPIP